MSRKRPICLTIAGFDPSGGAGILADIKVFEQHKTLGFAVQTANTIQSEDTFLKIEWANKNWVLDQLDLLLSKYKIHFFKIGLIEDLDILILVLNRLNQLNHKSTVIWDPVIKASSGGNFNDNRFDDFQHTFENLHFWITPNLIEYEQFVSKLSLENTHLYLKGGHSIDLGVDVLRFNGNEKRFLPKIQTKATKHGTGCVLSAALLANLALGFNEVKSCLKAKRYVENLISSNSSLLGYHKK
ncbi:MAG: bifunctional hydroxymethylpyrimidine kinase/phosphomethylpyrimidine kinase [Bacteroidetes bacterium]|nr:bifunctional hydroxymethylpyrimidine kinase/phosphomethylpyrimidine kinase [Bacteroidota bacterium]